MYDIAVCDDDGDFVARFRTLLSEIMAERGAAFQLSSFSDPGALLRAFNSGARFSLIFQDILFGVEKGIRFARMLRESDRDFELVFVTNNPEFAAESFSAFPLSFLVKPVTSEALARVVDRFLERRSPLVLQLTTPQGLLRIPLSDALYFEIYGHNVVIHLADGSEKTWRGALHELEAELPPNCFVRTHRSFLVNLAQISEIERGQVRLSAGGFVPISRSAYDHVIASMIAFDHRRRSTG